jgi:methionine-rich copper-binding protein CopC
MVKRPKLLMTALCFLLAAGEVPALAHAMLEHASPSAGDVLRTSPKTVTLSYTEALEPAFSHITVTDAAGHDVTAGPSTADGTTMSVTLRPLAPGLYNVKWQALSVDTHRTSGAFSFAVVR